MKVFLTPLGPLLRMLVLLGSVEVGMLVLASLTSLPLAAGQQLEVFSCPLLTRIVSVLWFCAAVPGQLSACGLLASPAVPSWPCFLNPHEPYVGGVGS